jgi:REase_DpnII-MboI/Family of unknown function (DUF5763)
MSEKCRGNTTQGRPCNREAGESGYCHLHDPSLREAKQKAATEAATRAKPLNEVIAAITASCEARGWAWRIETIDEVGYRHVAINVSRAVSTGYTEQQITGLCEITISAGGDVKVSLQRTSFHGYGISQLHEAMIDSLGRLTWLVKPDVKSAAKPPELTAAHRLEPILRRFHLMARQLRRRHDDRPTLTIGDEYDVQDLLHALLRGLFEDVRPEEDTPSYAGASARMDFLLKSEKMVVETKMASSRLRDRQIGEELIIDIKRYQTHPDCRTLTCFVYDPDGNVKNPEGLESDLSGTHGTLEVRVIVAPR